MRFQRLVVQVHSTFEEVHNPCMRGDYRLRAGDERQDRNDNEGKKREPATVQHKPAFGQ
jgi:hypothetical protein